MTIDTRHPVVEKSLALQEQWNKFSDDIVTVVSQKRSMEDDYIKRRMESILRNAKELEKEKNKLAENSTFLKISNKRWKQIGQYVSGGISASNFVTLGLTVYTTKHQNDSSNASIPPSTIAVQVASAVVALGAFVIITGWNCFDAKRLESSKALEQEADRATTMRLFFESYEEFIKQKNQHPTTPRYEEDTTTKLRQCLVKLDQVPSYAVPKRTRTLLRSAMIQALPDVHPLKQKLVRTHELARQISLFSSHSRLPLSTRTPPVSTSANSVPFNEPPSQPLEMERDPSGSGKENFLKTENAASSAPNADLQIDLIQPLQLKRDYSELISEMQKDLGLPIKEFAYGESCFNDDFQVSPIVSKPEEEEETKKEDIKSPNPLIVNTSRPSSEVAV